METHTLEAAAVGRKIVLAEEVLLEVEAEVTALEAEVTQPIMVLVAEVVETNQVVDLAQVVLGIKVLLLYGGDSNNGIICKSSQRGCRKSFGCRARVF
jgi:hypothetical protein